MSSINMQAASRSFSAHRQVAALLIAGAMFGGAAHAAPITVIDDPFTNLASSITLPGNIPAS